MQNQKVIEKLGYSPKEAKVYLTALSLGESHVSDIANKVKMPRSSVQVILDKLHKNGLMKFYVMGRYKYWIAEKPEQLLMSIIEKEEVVRDAIPSLIEIKENGRKKIRDKDSILRLGPLADVANLSVQAILITNSDIEIEYVNPIWEKLFGYTLDEVRGKSPRMFQGKKTPPETYIHMWNSLKLGKLFQSEKIVDQKKDGTLFTLLTSIFQVKYAERIFYVQILDTVTESE